VEHGEMRQRVRAAPVARLATVTPDGRPHLVPVCFALLATGDRDVIVSGTDEKPKRSLSLQRLRNLRANPAAALIVDHYEDDWTRVWWVRIDGRGRVLDDGPERDSAIDALREKYVQYEQVGLPGAVLVIDVERWRGWSYSV
jgi:PPOX class probable F420-dependent enzyme